MAEYAFEVKAQQWRDDPYYVASSAPVHKLTVVAETIAGARTEARNLLGPPSSHRVWKLWVGQGRDLRLVQAELTKENN